MRISIAILALFAATSSPGADRQPFCHPVRMVNGKTISLGPFFAYRQRAEFRYGFSENEPAMVMADRTGRSRPQPKLPYFDLWEQLSGVVVAIRDDGSQVIRNESSRRYYLLRNPPEPKVDDERVTVFAFKTGETIKLPRAIGGYVVMPILDYGIPVKMGYQARPLKPGEVAPASEAPADGARPPTPSSTD